MRALRVLSIAAVTALLGLCGCAPKVTTAPNVTAQNFSSVVVLPVEYPSGVQRERVDYLRTQVGRELQSNGFTVLDDRVVRETCLSPACSERTKLASQYGVQSFAALKIDSISRNNFLAGYYNAITGDLVFTDSKNSELLRVNHTQSERGGLLFNTGQIIQGIRSQIQNSEGDSYELLANKFVKTVVAKVPPPDSSSAAPINERDNVQITNVNLKLVRSSVYEVCAQATPHAIAALVVSRLRTNLRETEPGKYCGAYDLSSFEDKPVVEVRSPFGAVARKDVVLNTPAGESCDVDGRVVLQTENNRNKISLQCVRTASEPANPPSCAHVSDCQKYHFVVYRAPSDSGPFVKVAELKKPSWTDVSEKAGTQVAYQIVAVGANGSRSVPIPAKPSEKTM